MLRFKQFLLFEDTIEMGDNFGRRKKIVRPSPLTPDAAIRAFDLSQDYDPFAAFLDTENATDDEIISAFEKNKVGMESPSFERLNKRLKALEKEFTGNNLVSEKAKDIRAALIQERLRLTSPNITIDDATKLKEPPHIRAAKGMPPDLIELGWHNIGWWNNLTPRQRALYYKPDPRGIFQPEPSLLRNKFIFKEVQTPSKYTAKSNIDLMTGLKTGATTLLDPTQPVVDATVAQTARVSPKFANTDLLPASRSRIPNAPRPVASGLAYSGAGFVGSLAGEYIVKPAAEKVGVFDAVEKGSKAAFSRMPNWAVDVADKSLGAAQVILDPITPIANIMQKGMEASTQREVDSIIDARRPSQVRFRGPKF